MTSFDDLMAFQRETEALSQVAGRLGWDQETMMPRGAAEQRAEEMAAMESVLHGRRTDPRIADWLAGATPEGEVEAAQLREIRRAYDRAMKVPARLSSEIARVTSRAQGIWAGARAEEDPSVFLPILTEVIALRREEAACLSDGTGTSAYDALLQDYEPGATAAGIGAIFDEMRPRLVALREAIRASGKVAPTFEGRFEETVQISLAAEIARVFGYDFNHGRIDKAVHPFSSGSGLDVRITTRTDPALPLGALYSTLHEVGHGAYEQGVDPTYLLTPIGQGASMGVHESQSRIYENQLGRSRPFTSWLYGRMQDRFGAFGIADAEAFYRAVNAVETGFIRTEADEVHYNLHIFLRFDLEQALISGDLSSRDLEAAWNDRFAADFGLAVQKPSDGFLQDVHWSVGLFGYFPTYSLGNVYAGCLNAAIRAAHPGLDESLAEGDPSPATGWLRENLQRHGALRSPRATIEAATGSAPQPGPLLDYLEAKFADLYDL
ncbi:carboxypeptidase M32 [Ponticoccus sp. SC2-23]|uniref:carboxypeptidase M32 n=1 Tax=Alexandriicola marinus TaxID=2081710 RepID=UPI000FD9285F|nr:carboxypeptidase M32 [Alexandriicola marinus]MBM1218786.1 carboxypeptidase M32 [Ponticoccus sp. SC6-9]MBM1224142.1 carboxypeptidase M32 [Ponticoccus sp. SC6-15]MBM1230079.1 carboxypeptidase M32 [Ponticoccus sp. SC6-38]MBM1233108.1 carboxypeptidase M32 [Ponticoccus sp. SC6-45]MBM1236942.1 carboxypeptidase M32 [Ponticoccus sp. SC6-49]MBM1242119.1 carboxypeptidase M32 [Ponticoccus sp. SC2-64]MBM1246632.1 carboxypeptidase M32 [Ponticoccus sp. SC6-42]MBM1251110.1 carboxypeptidase M32 [Pontico